MKNLLSNIIKLHRVVFRNFSSEMGKSLNTYKQIRLKNKHFESNSHNLTSFGSVPLTDFI